MASQGQRKDSKNRTLHTGESIWANGKCQYKFLTGFKIKNSKHENDLLERLVKSNK